ncbi:MAG: hypothetical protein AAF488_16120 [Planctomycetota bacterium]
MSESPFAPPPEPDDARVLPPFREPWNPGHIMLLTFFGGMLTGGFLLFRNLERLGFRSAGRKILIISLAYTMVVIGVGSYLGVDRAKKRKREETMAKLLGESDREPFDSAATEKLLRDTEVLLRNVDAESEEPAGDSTGERPDGGAEAPPEAPTPSSSDTASPEEGGANEEAGDHPNSGEERSLAELLDLDDASMEKKREEDQRFRFLVRNIFAVGAVLIAWVLARPQFPRFQWAMSEGEPPGKLFLPALGAIALSWVIELVGVAIGVTIFVMS